MPRKRWHILRNSNVLTLARRLPVRFDLSVATHLPEGSCLKVAHQVRQDIWRALQGLRGFAPVVQVERTADGLSVIAGGQVDGPVSRSYAEARIEAVLEDPANRARWIGWAG